MAEKIIFPIEKNAENVIEEKSIARNSERSEVLNFLDKMTDKNLIMSIGPRKSGESSSSSSEFSLKNEPETPRTVLKDENFRIVDFQNCKNDKNKKKNKTQSKCDEDDEVVRHESKTDVNININLQSEEILKRVKEVTVDHERDAEGSSSVEDLKIRPNGNCTQEDSNRFDETVKKEIKTIEAKKNEEKSSKVEEQTKDNLSSRLQAEDLIENSNVNDKIIQHVKRLLTDEDEENKRVNSTEEKSKDVEEIKEHLTTTSRTEMTTKAVELIELVQESASKNAEGNSTPKEENTAKLDEVNIKNTFIREQKEEDNDEGETSCLNNTVKLIRTEGKYLMNVSKNGGIENNLTKREKDKKRLVFNNSNLELALEPTSSMSRTKFVQVFSSRKSNATIQNLANNFTKILSYPTNGTTIVYQETTFEPILLEGFRKKLENANEEQDTKYLPLEVWTNFKMENGSKMGRTTEQRLEPREEDVLEAADYGMQAMNDLYYIKEPKLFSMGLFLSENNPARFVAAFNEQTEEAKQLAKFGYAALEGARMFVSKFPDISREAPFVRDTRRTALHRQCPRRGIPQCPPASLRYRTTDGSCNNPRELWWGSSMSTMQRFLPPVYQDGIQSIRRSVTGKPLPSPREISNHIHQDRDIPLASVTHMLMQWGQFVDHDITATGQSRAFNGTVPQCCLNQGAGFQPPEFMHPECLPISVSPKDTFFGRFGVRCLEFVRSGPAPREDCEFGPREQLFQVTSYLDASTVYSSNALHSDSLRIFRNGLLQYGRIQSRKPLLPRQDSDLCRRGSLSTTCFRAGDGRLSEQPGLTSLHVVFLRQHNRIATQLSALNSHWSDEKLFQETRRIIGALIQHITYREFLPIVLGPEVMKLFDLEILKKGYYEGYDPTVNPNVANSFSTAAYRFGHSLVQSSFVRYDRDHRPIFNNVSIHNEFSNPENLETAGSVDRLLLGLVNQPSQKRDEFITDELTNHLFQTPIFPFGLDLASLNIQRGRDHGIPPYVDWREPCSLSSIRHWDDLERVMSPTVAKKFKLLYSAVEDIDLFPAGLSEKSVSGGLVGPTFACIIAQQFSHLRKGDRFWYENPNSENSFSPAQLKQIKRVTLAQILCRTMDGIDTVQPFVFLIADNFRNERLPCNSEIIGNLNLEPWQERLHEGRNNSNKKKKNKKKKNKTKLSSKTKHLNDPSNSMTSSKRDQSSDQRFFSYSLKPIKTNINQHNRISVKRPIGSPENLTIVVQNNAVNSPVFVNDAFTGTNFQISHQPTSGVQQRPDHVQRPASGLSYVTQVPNYHSTSYRPIHKPIPTARPHSSILQYHQSSRPYVPHNFDDPSNPNPPNYGFHSKPMNEYPPNNVFFDSFPMSTPRPTLYTYYTTFKRKSTTPRPSYHFNDPHSAHLQQSSPFHHEGVNQGSSRPSYTASRPSATRPYLEENNNHFSSDVPQTPLTQRPIYDNSWNQESHYDGNWAGRPGTQSDLYEWTNIPPYPIKPSKKPDSSKPQYWPQYEATTTSRNPSTSFYNNPNFQAENAQQNIDPRPLKTHGDTLVTESDEIIYYTGNKRFRPPHIKNEVPRPLVPQHKIDEVELTERTQDTKSGQYYYIKNVLHRYPNKTNFRNSTKLCSSSSNNEEVNRHDARGCKNPVHESDDGTVMNRPDGVVNDGKDKVDKTTQENLKFVIDSKYQIEELDDQDHRTQSFVNSATNAQIVREEVKLTTTATIVLDDDNDGDGSQENGTTDDEYYDDEDDDDDDDDDDNDDDDDDNEEEDDEDLDEPSSADADSVTISYNTNRATERTNIQETLNFSSIVKMPEIMSNEFTNTNELPKPIKLRRHAT